MFSRAIDFCRTNFERNLAYTFIRLTHWQLMRSPIVVALRLRDVILHVILSLSIHASSFYERTLEWIAVERQKVTVCPG